MEQLTRRPLTASLAEAVAYLQDGMTLAIGGFNTASKPMALVREIIRQGRKNLTVVAPPSSIEVDLLVATGCVAKVITPYVGAEALAPVCPFYRAAVQQGTIEIREVDAGIVLTMLRAARQGLPFLPWRGGIGTSLPELNRDLKIIDDPFGGQKLLAVPPVYPDLAILHAAQADAYGNVQHLGNPFADALIAAAAKHTIVQVERIVPNEVIRKAPELTTVLPIFVNAVVAAPYGAHPFFSQRYYLIDRAHISEYIEAGLAYLAGNKSHFEQYLERYVYGPRGHEDYLQAVGFERILSLQA